MRNRIIRHIIAALVAVVACHQPAAAAIRLIEPRPWSIINSNGIRLRAELDSSFATGTPVAFFVRYSGAAAHEARGHLSPIAVDSTPPYEHLFDCSQIPDQAWYDLLLRVEAVDSSSVARRSERVYVILDRNPALSTLVHHVRSIGRRSPSLRDLRSQEPITLHNAANSYAVRFLASPDTLHFFCTIRDSAQVCIEREGLPNPYTQPWDSTEGNYFGFTDLVFDHDFIGLFFAPHPSPLADSTARLLYIQPDGTFFAPITLPRRSLTRNWGHTIRVRTIARDDSLVTIRGAIHRAALGEGLDELWFQFYASDKDTRDGLRVIASWAGSPHNHLNPSEWGRLVIDPQPPVVLYVWLAVATAVMLVAGVAVGIRRRPTPAEQPSAAEQPDADPLISAARGIIDREYANPELCREYLAEQLRISSGYLGNIFKKSTGKSLPGYINDIRIQKAAELLRQGGYTVSRAAAAVGYSTARHFSGEFRKRFGQSPRQFQHRNAPPDA